MLLTLRSYQKTFAGFTLIKLLVARHPKLQRRKAILGFTLIELLVVITIIGILVSAAAVSWTNAQKKGRDSKRKTDVKAVQQALETYFRKNGRYPQVTSSSNDTAWQDTAQTGLAQSLVAGGFIKELPKDSVNTWDGSGNPDTNYVYSYTYTGSGEVYFIYFNVENNKDPNRESSGTWWDIKVTNP